MTGEENKVGLVMVIEDETVLLRVIVDKLQSANIDTISCARAEQALDYLKEMDELPDVIWLDYFLKGKMDGLDFIQTLKQKEEWKNIPVIVVSNTASGNKVKNMLALGANKYVLKAEHRLEEILSIVQEVMHIND